MTVHMHIRPPLNKIKDGPAVMVCGFVPTEHVPEHDFGQDWYIVTCTRCLALKPEQ